VDQEIIVHFFSQVVQHDAAILTRIKLFQGDMQYEQKSQQLIFKLPALFQFLNTESKLKYSEFRRLIYQSSINRELQQVGAKIEIHQSSNTVDDSVYKLYSV